MKESEPKFLSDDCNATISLLNTYLTELIHRDQIFTQQIFKYFYTVLIIILLPNLTSHFLVELPP